MASREVGTKIKKHCTGKGAGLKEQNVELGLLPDLLFESRPSRCICYILNLPLQYTSASLVAQMVKNPPAMQETRFDPWVGMIPWRREWQVSRGSAGEYQSDERAGVTRLRWRVSSR